MTQKGNKAKTMAELAHLAGVSVATASRALRDSPLVTDETKAHVKAVAKKYDYQPHRGARNLRLRKSHTIVLILPLNPANNELLSNPFVLKFLGAVGASLRNSGYDLLVSQEGLANVQIKDRYIRSGLADGAIFLGRGKDPQIFADLVADQVPFVVWGPRLSGQTYCSVGIDNVAIAQASVEHLIDHGRRRIAIISGDLENQRSEGFLRYKGYRAALAASQIAFDPLLVTEASLDSASGKEAINQLLQKAPDIDAVFVAYSDSVAIAAMQALAENGKRVPEDVAVVGFDNIDISAFTSPPLTTVSQRLQDGGAALLVEKLLQQIAGQEAESVMLQGELVVRHSCGAH